MPDQPGMQYDAFLCHNSAQKGWTRDLARRMKREGLEVWFDEWCIRGGENTIRAMERGVTESRHLVFVASPGSLDSEWTDFEESIAMLEDPAAKRRMIIPILHTHCKLPPRLGFRQHIDFTDTHGDESKYEFRLAQLMADVDPTRTRPVDYDEFRVSLGDSDPDAIPPITLLPPGSRMGMRPNPCFVGREDELKGIAKRLNAARATAIGQVGAVTGLGGIGKTQLAVEYVHRYGRLYPGGVFWLDMEDAEGIRNEIALCGGIDGMNLPGFDQLGQPDKVKTVQSIWREETARLLVFDNIEKPETAEEWIPTSGGVRVLITSRCENWPATMGIDPLSLETLPPDESLKLLLTNRPEALADEEEKAAAVRVCGTLGHLPLALDMARAYLGRYKNEVSLVEYEKELKAKPVLEDSSLVDFVTDPSPTRHIQNIAATFEVSYEKLKEDNETDALATKLFHMVSHFAPTSISRKLLGKTAGLDPEESDDRKSEADAINRLVSLGLIQEEGDGRLLMHRLLREFALYNLPPSMTIDECADAFEEKIALFASQANEYGVPSKLAVEMEHLRHAATKASARHSSYACHLLANIGFYHGLIADYQTAMKYNRRALETGEKTYGPDHPEVAVFLNNLGLVVQAQGDLDGARKNFEKALQIDEKTLGPDHHKVAIRLNNLGSVLRAQGNLEGARKNYERALEIWEKALGPDHPNVAIGLNNLGLVLQDLGDLEGARKNFERAVEIFRKFLGDEHPNTIKVRRNLEFLDSLGSD